MFSFYFIPHRWTVYGRKYRGFHLRREFHLRLGPLLFVFRWRKGP